MHQYCWTVSLAWPWSAIHCSSSRDELGSAVYTPSLPSSGAVPELEMGSVSAFLPLPNGLLPLFSEVNRAELKCMECYCRFSGVCWSESV